MSGGDIVVYSNLDEDLDYSEIRRVAEPFKHDIYGNEYFDTGEHIEIKPAGNSFEELSRNILIYAHNFYTLENPSGPIDGCVNVPDFQMGFDLEDGPEPYFVTDKVEGVPLPDIEGSGAIFEDDIPQEHNLARLKRSFDEFNDVGWFLGTRNMISYSKPRQNQDILVAPDYEAIYTNPGAADEPERVQKAIENSELIGIEDFEKWTQKRFWKSKTPRKHTPNSAL